MFVDDSNQLLCLHWNLAFMNYDATCITCNCTVSFQLLSDDG